MIHLFYSDFYSEKLLVHAIAGMVEDNDAGEAVVLVSQANNNQSGQIN